MVGMYMTSFEFVRGRRYRRSELIKVCRSIKFLVKHSYKVLGRQGWLRVANKIRYGYAYNQEHCRGRDGSDGDEDPDLELEFFPPARANQINQIRL